MKLFTYRYMWTDVEKPDKVCFKLITDTEEGLKLFEKNLVASFKVGQVVHIGREYVSEFDVSKLGVFENLDTLLS